MAYVITDVCDCCDACLAECPNEAITAGDDIYVIDPFKCTECVGFFDEPQCASVCPMECCDPDPQYPEDEDTLLEKARSLNPDEEIDDDFPSHFRA